VSCHKPSVSLEIKNLSCIRDDRVLFESLGFELESGQILLLEGQNGSGKSSLLRILCGFREPDAGEILWCGRQRDDSGFYQQMAYVGHLDGIKKELSVQENLGLVRALGSPGRYSIQQALEQVHLSGYEDVPVQSLSAGQRRRIALSRLLITDNRLWILDEPFTALDKTGIGIFEQLMAEHAQQGGLIMLTSHHDLTLDALPVQHIRLS